MYETVKRTTILHVMNCYESTQSDNYGSYDRDRDASKNGSD